MTAAAPHKRMVCQLTGEIAQSPSKFFTAMDQADTRVDEVERLRARIAELEAALASAVSEAQR